MSNFKDEKVAVLTHYHNSINYGGLLQAYALIKALAAQGIRAEQISFDLTQLRAFAQNGNEIHQSVKKSIISRIIARIKYIFEHRFFSKYKSVKLTKRNENFKYFRDSIPHTEKTYNSKNICELNEKYDVFVTGSDQVWSFAWFSSAFFLDFADKDKKKLAYAASTGKSDFTNDEKEYLNNVLSDFDGISVRESDLTDSLKDAGIKNAQWVVDPTLLLTAQDWDSVAAEKLVNEKYLFCYFLGDDQILRKLAKKFARKHNLKLVTIPFANQSYNKTDFTFGDIKMFDAGPKEFISLIKNAEYVFTDSFHASVFSLLYKRQFFVFKRKNGEKMGSRLVSLTSLFECPNHFCCSDDSFCLEHLEKIEPIDYNKTFQKFNEIKESSEAFLFSDLQR